MGLVLKVQKYDWREVGRPQVAMLRNCYIVSSFVFSNLSWHCNVGLLQLKIFDTRKTGSASGYPFVEPGNNL